MKQLAIVLALAILPAIAARAESVSFGIFGDTPYNSSERNRLPGLINEMDAENLAVIIHIGDIKSGHSPCSDEVFRDILGAFQAAQTPLVYVPGDNEWTDCHRKDNGQYDSVERLHKLRELFFADDFALGQRKLKLERQSRQAGFEAYVENVRWEMGGVLFVGLNIPGSDNNIGKNPLQPSAEFLARGRANQHWLHESFAIATARKMPGILIAIQADPDFDADAMGHTNLAYRDFLKQLREETLAFPGKVVLAHGDTHYQRIDKPLFDAQTFKSVANFTRVETYGSPFMGWVKGVVDTNDREVFRFSPRLYSPIQ